MPSEYLGALFIGDPHLAHRAPGSRRDDYGRAILDKLRWSLDYARSEKLLPCLLGDLFHFPRDNANWLIGELCEMLVGREVVAIYGNHDAQENVLSENDSLSVPIRAGLVRMLSEVTFWEGRMGGRPAIVGGTNYGEYKPKPFPRGFSGETLVLWMTHHDLQFPGYEAGRVEMEELPGIHVVVNGHIHRKLDPVFRRKTTWLNPGNIARVKRSEGVNVPAVLRIDVTSDEWRETYVTVPHRPSEEVFADSPAPEGELPLGGSDFVRGLKTLTAPRAGGENLETFLQHNLDRFEPDVRREILDLAKEVSHV